MGVSDLATVCIWVGWVLLVVFLLAIIVLLMPVALAVDCKPGLTQIRLQLLFFRIDLSRLIPKGEDSEKSHPQREGGQSRQSEDEKSRQEQEKRKKWVQRKKAAAFIRKLPQLLEAAGAFLRAVFRVLSFRKLRFFIPIHGEDAAQTARDVGAAYAVAAGLDAALRSFLQLHWDKAVFYPDYSNDAQDQLEISGKVVGQLLPLLIAVIALLLQLEKEGLLPVNRKKSSKEGK